MPSEIYDKLSRSGEGSIAIDGELSVVLSVSMLMSTVCRGQLRSALTGLILTRERRRVAKVPDLALAAIEGTHLPPAAAGDRADTATIRALTGT